MKILACIFSAFAIAQTFSQEKKDTIISLPEGTFFYDNKQCYKEFRQLYTYPSLQMSSAEATFTHSKEDTKTQGKFSYDKFKVQYYEDKNIENFYQEIFKIIYTGWYLLDTGKVRKYYCNRDDLEWVFSTSSKDKKLHLENDDDLMLTVALTKEGNLKQMSLLFSPISKEYSYYIAVSFKIGRKAEFSQIKGICHNIKENYKVNFSIISE